MTPQSYDSGFTDGLTAAVTLGRAGIGPEDLAALLPEDPGRAEPRQYQDQLCELRKIMGTGFGA